MSSNYPRQYHHSPLSFSAIKAVFKKFSLFCHMCISSYNLPTSLQLNQHFKKQNRNTAKKNKKENKSSTYDHFIWKSYWLITFPKTIPKGAHLFKQWTQFRTVDYIISRCILQKKTQSFHNLRSKVKIATQSYWYWVCAELTKAFDFLPLIIFLELPLVTGSCKSREQLHFPILVSRPQIEHKENRFTEER